MKPSNAIYPSSFAPPASHAGGAARPARRDGRSGKKFVRPLLLALPLILLSSGCANMPKEASLSMGGAMAGAAIGAQHGGLRGALIGAVIGGFIGQKIGSHLDEEDKKKLAELEIKSLDSGKPMTFVTNKTKATITLTPDLPKTETVRSYALASAVEPYQLKVIAVKDIAALVDTPIFGDINEKSVPIALVKKGEALRLQAHVEKNGEWGAIIESDVVTGYVPLRYLDQKIVKQQKSDNMKLAKAKPVAVPPKARLASNAALPVAAPAIQPASPAALPGAAVKPQLAVLTPQSAASGARVVQAVGTCKSVTRLVDTGNKADSLTEVVKYCQEPPPKWKTYTS